MATRLSRSICIVAAMLLLTGCPVKDPASTNDILFSSHTRDRCPDVTTGEAAYFPAGQESTLLLDEDWGYYWNAGSQFINALPTLCPMRQEIEYGTGNRQDLYAFSAYDTREPGELARGVQKASGLAVVWVHGGGWIAGDKSGAVASPYLQYLMDQGHVVFAINYTLAPADFAVSPFPQNFRDVQTAIGWANSDDAKADYGHNHVVVLGHSAGGHLAALATTRSNPGDVPDILPEELPAGWDHRPAAGVAIAAPLNMITFGRQSLVVENVLTYQYENGGGPFDIARAGFSAFWGPGPEEGQVPPVMDQPRSYWEKIVGISASPIWHVDDQDPPLYLIASAKDILAPPDTNALPLENRYAAVFPNFREESNDPNIPANTIWAYSDIVDEGGHNPMYSNSSTLNNHVANINALDAFLAAVAAGLVSKPPPLP